MKEYKDLTFADDFIFCKVLTNNPNLCQELLELIFGKEVGMIQSIEPQKSVKITKDGKGIRFDVYGTDGKILFDCEMQTTEKPNLRRRTRYYQGMIDLNQIESGADYSELKESYVIFICPFNPFDNELHKYTFENRCLENPELRLDDGTSKIFLCTDGRENDVSDGMMAFLDYVAGRKVDDPFVNALDAEVEKARNHDEWRQEYMTLMMRDQEKINEGKEIGRMEGRIEAICRMLSKGCDKSFILSLDYSEEELAQAEQSMLVNS